MKWVFAIIIWLSLVACDQGMINNHMEEKDEIATTGPAILYIDGMQYSSTREAEPNEFTIESKLGEVQLKVGRSVSTPDKISSNYLEKGTELYRVKEDKNIVLAKVSDEKYQVFYRK